MTADALKLEENDYSVAICDEFDLMMDKSAVKFKKLGAEVSLCGLAQVFHSKRTYMLSATYDYYDLKVLKLTFDVVGENIHDCWSKEEIVSGHRKKPFTSHTIVKPTEH